MSAGLEHVRSSHTGGGNRQSQFLVDPAEVLSEPRVIRSEPRPLPIEGDITVVRQAELPTAVGRTRAGQGSRLTNAVRVQTDARGNLITAYPIPGWRAEFNVQISTIAIQADKTNRIGEAERRPCSRLSILRLRLRRNSRPCRAFLNSIDIANVERS